MDTTVQNTITSFAAKFINNTNRTIFLTGKAGTGKTTFLKYITKHTYKNVIIAAPTGIAAINAGGVTLHSLFQLPFGAFIPSSNNASTSFSINQKFNTANSLLKGIQLNSSKRKLLQELELLIIDEVSMLRADLLDAIDTVLRNIRRKNTIPFGGVQILFIGDLLQLPPVVKNDEWQELKKHYKSIYFFEALALKETPPLYIELDKIYRQADNTFISILNNLRNNQITNADIEILNQYYQPNLKSSENKNYIQLTTHNHKADNLNKLELQKLNEPSFFFKAELTGDFNEFAYPIDENLELKKGAQIMFIKNDASGGQRFFNGKIGKISNINKTTIEVEFENSTKAISVDKYEWKNVKYSLNEITNEIEENIVGTFIQYPIKLAWAITIHKSQGLTFDKAIIDIGDAFASGQVYVALSRLTSLNGLILSSPINFNSISLDTNITKYSNNKVDESILTSLLEKESQLFYNDYILNCFNLSFLNNSLQKHMESYSVDKDKSVKKKYFEWAMNLKTEFMAIKLHADKFLVQLKKIIDSQEPDYKEQLKSRILSAKNYFSPLLKQFSTTILKQVEKLKTEKRIKLYLSELIELDAAFYKQIQLINKAEALLISAINNVPFSKELSSIETDSKERLKEATDILNSSKKATKKEKKGAELEQKVDSKQISYNLYKQNKSIEMIAKERGMAQTTIEAHLSYYVSLGLLNVSDFVKKEKMENIISVSKTIDTTLYSPIKQALSDEYSYSEIKFAMAFYQNSKK